MSERSESFGQGYKLTPIDRFGTWLSRRKLLAIIGDVGGKTLADVGCGYDVRFGRSLLGKLGRLVAVDVSINPEVLAFDDVVGVVGLLPESLTAIETDSCDVIVLNSVLEHLDEPRATLTELRRMLRPGGLVFVNVPTWLGKIALETSAFRLHLSPAEEIEDHRRYYNRHELWVALREVGFAPSRIKVRTHKFGLNVYAVATTSAGVE